MSVTEVIPSQDWRRVALFGGIYSNHVALAAALKDAESRTVDAMLCLGDLGAFGPSPDRIFPLLRDREIPVVRGNYDDSIARGLDDCQCGYTDPADNHFARLSYRYTFERTSVENREWMSGLPDQIRFRLGELEVLACHGSPRQMNEFLWESTTPTHFLEKLSSDFKADVIVSTHTGLPWERPFETAFDRESGRGTTGAYVNVGALGRPANDGDPRVWYAVLEADGRDLTVEFVRVAYDTEALAAEMRAEGLPEEFVETILTGWWTSCLEILPAKERSRGRF